MNKKSASSISSSRKSEELITPPPKPTKTETNSSKVETNSSKAEETTTLSEHTPSPTSSTSSLQSNETFKLPSMENSPSRELNNSSEFSEDDDVSSSITDNFLSLSENKSPTSVRTLLFK